MNCLNNDILAYTNAELNNVLVFFIWREKLLCIEQWPMSLLYVVTSLGVILFWLIVALSAVGRSFGVTKLYIRILLFIFEVR